MNNTLYTQIVHLLAMGVVGALLVMGKGDALSEWLALGALVGVALPSPFAPAAPAAPVVSVQPAQPAVVPPAG